MPLDGGGGLGHLHQGENALLQMCIRDRGGDSVSRLHGAALAVEIDGQGHGVEGNGLEIIGQGVSRRLHQPGVEGAADPQGHTALGPQLLGQMCIRDSIIIEPSGVGKLSDVIAAVEGVQKTTPALHLHSFVTVVDATKAKVYMKNFGEFFNNQVEHASAILLSRTQMCIRDSLHPQLPKLLDIAAGLGFQVNLTTNGTLPVSYTHLTPRRRA